MQGCREYQMDGRGIQDGVGDRSWSADVIARNAVKSVGVLDLLLPSSVALFVLVAFPVLCVKVPPTADYVNHLARNYIIAFGADDPILSSFYTIQWKIVPNLAMDLIVPPLAHLFGIFTAGKLFILGYMALLFTGPQAIYRALFRRFSLGPLVAALFVYNGANRDGVVNYLFGVGVSLWSVAFWIALRRARAPVRCITSLAFIAVLFISHLATVGLYGLGILAYEIWLFSSGGRRIDRQFWIDAMVFAVPFLIVPLLLTLGPTVGFIGSWQWIAGRKIYGPIEVIHSEHLRYDLGVALALGAAAGMAWWSDRVRVHPVGWILLGLAVPIYLALPWRVLSAENVDVRIPIGVLFLGLGMIDWKLPTRYAQRLFIVIVLLFTSIRVGFVAAVWLPFRHVTTDLEASLQQVPLGSRIMIARPHDTPWTDFGLFYLPCLAMIERSSLVSIAHSHPGQQVLVVKPAFREFAGGWNDDPPDIRDVLAERLPPGSPPWSRLYWKDWTKHYDYMYMIWNADSPNPAPDRLTELHRGEDFRLYRINKGSSSVE
jgi:hypothetical protein